MINNFSSLNILVKTIYRIHTLHSSFMSYSGLSCVRAYAYERERERERERFHKLVLQVQVRQPKSAIVVTATSMHKGIQNVST